MNTGIICTPLYWECSELQFDTLIQKIRWGEAEKFMIVNAEKVSCALIFVICFEKIGLAATAKKIDNSNDEFLRFPWPDFLDQGVKLKLKTFSIQWCKNYSCIHQLLPTENCRLKKHILFLSRTWPLDLRLAASDSDDSAFYSWENNKLLN